MTWHRIGLVARLLLHVATIYIVVDVLFVAHGNSVANSFVHTLVPFVHPVLLLASLIVLPSVLVESLVSVHSRGRRLQFAKTAATASPSVEAIPAVEAAWGDLFNEAPDPRRFGGAEASFLLVTAPWDHLDMTETQQPERVFVPGLVPSPLCGILGSAAALAGLGLILVSVVM